MIRAVNVKDSLAIMTICQQALGYATELSIVQKQINRLSHDKTHFILVYESNKQVVGFIHAQSYDSLYVKSGINILALAVLPAYQQQGIGTQLLSSLEKDVSYQDYQFIRLNSAEHRHIAHDFYEKHGYSSDKWQKRFLKYL